MNLPILGAAILLVTAGTFAAPPARDTTILKNDITVAIVPFKASGSLSSDDVSGLAQAIRSKMKSNRVVPITDVGGMEKAVVGRRMEEPECLKIPACLAQLGEDLEADFVVTGTVDESYGIVTITLLPFDVYRKQMWDKVSEIKTGALKTWSDELTSKIASDFSSRMYAKRPPVPPPKPTSGVLKVTTKPSGAVVFVGNDKKGPAPLTIDGVKPGKHRIRAEQGRWSTETEATIKAGDTASVQLSLVAFLKVTTTPNAAPVFFDGKPVGTSPVILPDVSPGNHTLTAVDKDSTVGEQHLDLDVGDSAEIVLDMKPTLGGLRIATTPPGATVYLDTAKLAGTSPLVKGRLPAGSYRVRAVGKDSSVAEQKVQVRAGDTLDVNLVLKATTATVEVSTLPAGAAVFLDSARLSGVTPLVVSKIKPGKYLLRALGSDSSVAEQRVELVAADTARVQLTLKATTATLRVETAPAGAAVYLDTVQLKGASPVILSRIKPGSYTVRALGKDSAVAVQKVKLAAAETTQVSLTLKSTKGALRVVTTPPGATVFLDSMKLDGGSPVTVSRLAPGSYRVRAIGPDSSVAEQSARLVAAETTLVELKLKPTRAALSVTTIPAGAALYLDKVALKGVSPLTIGGLKPGKHVVRAVGDDSAAVEETVELIAGDTARVQLAIRATTATLNVVTTPAGATVFLDSTKLGGVSPITVSRLKPGRHVVRAVGKDSAHAEQMVELVAADTARVQLSLKLTTATLSVTTTPKGAAVFLDSTKLGGVSPITVSRLKPGRHVVRAIGKDSALAEQVVELVAADTTRVELALRLTTAALRVTTTPAGATVYLDSTKLKGMTPILVSRLKPGKRALRAVGTDSAVADRAIELVAGDTTEIAVTLSATTAKVRVVTIPAGAAVFLDTSRVAAASPVTLDRIRPGAHVLRAIGKDSAEARQKIEVAAGDSIVVELRLRSTTATLSVRTTPPKAVVYLDTMRLPKVTPLTADKIKPGTYTVRIVGPDGAVAEKKVELVAGDTANVAVALAATTATLKVASTPAGATVYLDSTRLSGVTPLVGSKLAPGKYLVTVVGRDSSVAQEKVELVAGDTVSVNFALKSKLAALSITTVPAGATVYVDSVKISGKAPVVVGRLRPGYVTVRAVGNDSSAAEQIVELVSADTSSVTLRLKPTLGALRITTMPANAHVFIDTVRLQGSQPLLRARLKSGVYRVRARNADGSGADTSVEVAAGDTAKVHLEIRAVVASTVAASDTIAKRDTIAPPDTAPAVKPAPPAVPAAKIATLVVKSVPSGATVCLDSIDLPDVTPMELVGCPPGIHHIKLVKGSAREIVLVEVAEGDTTEIEIELQGVEAPAAPQADTSPARTAGALATEKRRIKLAVATNPPGAQVYLNAAITKWSRPAFVTPNYITALERDTLRFAVALEGFRDSLAAIYVAPGASETITIDLVKADSAELARQALRGRERTRARAAFYLLPSSGALVLGSVIFYALAGSDYRAALDSKEYLEGSILDRSSSTYRSKLRENRDRTSSGNTKSGVGTSMLILGGAALGAGLYLTF